MGILDLFSNKEGPRLSRLPSGSFTMDAEGRILACTLPQSFPRNCLEEIGGAVLSAFLDGQKNNLPLAELVVRFGSLKVTARELRGGAIIFLAPHSIKGP